ncbi:MAG: hypothetical protein A2233_02855 [Candidatus Kerfeldbacteria bacterium RIFOXYA2_FULL_38_24]|uniref:Heparan-alpha-glucosaminide N-acetyltransferase catalytic domain-containing protein n=1 Tax=Candidatus Kerfeldbacteria bacterium RIFOXYB2_FULL_38_14 TaxID=1798547 RepID=A0A1G2B9F7_9BACT|nr:MAG: hypothetical protein A2319_00730 [Candidatus Kerfeldbacteria bacterium RIFOXYB2_FULL_38_14]OGY86474.1 MAG: hypothetical protein A2233_02855 [Candidatus Kerfeldbacteria bacterium RIFOXYA2_FULL_38_24]OGY88582.1 MAG: hypothetical protein A2458_00515 [Candidatus Kerfeldbacteria bacterium RIFOXYC2_FULL_38_9]
MSKRIIIFDLWKGTAVIGMIIFHFFLILNLFAVIQINLYSGFWLILVRFVQLSFLLLTGVNLVLVFQNYPDKKIRHQHQKHRYKILFCCCGLISLISFILVPSAFIFFGILHLILVSSILITPLVSNKKTLWLGLVFSLLITIFLKVLGWQPTIMPSSIDFFPLFPWINAVFFGALLGVYQKKIIPKKLMAINLDHNKKRQFLAWCGRNSLLIYLIHVPVLIILLGFLKII